MCTHIHTSSLIKFMQQHVERTDNLTQVFVKLCMEIDALCVWSVPLSKRFPSLHRHLLWSRCWVGRHCSHWENRNLIGGTEHFFLFVFILLLFTLVPSPFSRGRAAVHEEASSSSSSYTHNKTLKWSSCH